MKKSVLLPAFAIVSILALLIAIDGDPAGMLIGNLETTTRATAGIDLDALSQSDRGAVTFAFGDFGALSSEAAKVSAAPWKLTTALLALEETNGDVEAIEPGLIKTIFARYGFPDASMIANWPIDASIPDMSMPFGQNVGFASRMLPPMALTIGNVGCSACHASVVYDAEGMPDTSTIWLGTPNGSINIERYVQELYQAMRDRSNDEEAMWAAVDKLYPDMDWREKLALKTAVLPTLKDRVAEMKAGLDRMLPFTVSTAGATNGLQALQARYGLIPAHQMAPVSVPISVPELGGRAWRSSLLAAGNYAVPGADPWRDMSSDDLTDEHLDALAGVTAFFTVPSMGVTPETAFAHITDARDIMQWLATDYRPQPFPGRIDEEMAARGRAIYADQCASCHGTHDAAGRLVSFPNVQSDMRTDRAYLELFDEATVGMVDGLGFSTVLEGKISDQYAAPPLTGLWSSAPYLHNGSVPTLWHLMHPEERPVSFEVGGHSLDYDKVGIDGETMAGRMSLPVGYEPWSPPTLIDTTVAGMGNGGHETPFVTMSETDKADLLEYLKSL